MWPNFLAMMFVIQLLLNTTRQISGWILELLASLSWEQTNSNQSVQSTNQPTNQSNPLLVFVLQTCFSQTVPPLKGRSSVHTMRALSFQVSGQWLFNTISKQIRNIKNCPLDNFKILLKRYQIYLGLHLWPQEQQNRTVEDKLTLSSSRWPGTVGRKLNCNQTAT